MVVTEVYWNYRSNGGIQCKRLTTVDPPQTEAASVKKACGALLPFVALVDVNTWARNIGAQSALGM